MLKILSTQIRSKTRFVHLPCVLSGLIHRFEIGRRHALRTENKEKVGKKRSVTMIPVGRVTIFSKLRNKEHADCLPRTAIMPFLTQPEHRKDYPVTMLSMVRSAFQHRNHED